MVIRSLQYEAAHQPHVPRAKPQPQPQATRVLSKDPPRASSKLGTRTPCKFQYFETLALSRVAFCTIFRERRYD
jgi:hypothetical protein